MVQAWGRRVVRSTKTAATGVRARVSGSATNMLSAGALTLVSPLILAAASGSAVAFVGTVCLIAAGTSFLVTPGGAAGAFLTILCWGGAFSLGASGVAGLMLKLRLASSEEKLKKATFELGRLQSERERALLAEVGGRARPTKSDNGPVRVRRALQGDERNV